MSLNDDSPPRGGVAGSNNWSLQGCENTSDYASKGSSPASNFSWKRAMTFHVLATGTLFRAPKQRTAKSGNPFVRARLRETTGGVTEWISLVAFSQSACAELLRLDDGDAVSVQGVLKIEKYEKDGETKVSLSVTANLVTAFRQSSKRKEPKSPGNRSRQDRCPGTWSSGDSPDDPIPL